MTQFPDKCITQIAFDYNYNSLEAFTRAFIKMWGVSPSEFRKKWHFTGIFPRLELPESIGGNKDMRKRVDISEMYDILKERKNCYFVCADIAGLLPINENLGREAGDKAILETARRLDVSANEDDIVFRVGGDEFVILTNSPSEEYAKDIVKKIKRHNGELVTYSEGTFPLNLHVGYYLEHANTLRYSELFTHIQDSICDFKK